MSKSVKRTLLAAVIAALLALTGLIALSPRISAKAADDDGVSIRNRVYRKAEGVNKFVPNIGVLGSDAIEVVISIDVPMNCFAYFGLNATPNGNGGAASGRTAGIGLLVYNSNNSCMALEMYNNSNWGQLTETTEFSSVKPTDTVTLSIKTVGGSRGLYVNGELFTAVAKGQGGTTAGEIINPMDYMPVESYSANGKTYFEFGTWGAGGSATVYAQEMSGTLSLIDRDGEAVKGYTVEAAYDEYGNEIELLESVIDGRTFSLTSLSGNLIKSLKAATAGGVTVKAAIGEDTAVAGSDCVLNLTDGENPVDKAEFTVRKNSRDITEYVKVTYNKGGYYFEDCEGSLTVDVSRAGFNPVTLTLSSSEQTECVMTEKNLTFTVALTDEASGNPVIGKADILAVYLGERKTDAEITEKSAGVYHILGFAGRTGNLQIRFEEEDYVTAVATVDEFSDGETVKMYTSKSYNAIVIAEEGSAVTAGDKTFTADGTVYKLNDVTGDITVKVTKAGKATRYAFLNSANNYAVLTTSDVFDLGVKLAGVADGSTLKYIVDGFVTGEAVVRGGVSVIPQVGLGCTVTLEIDGVTFKNDTFTVESRSVSPEFEAATQTVIELLYNGSAAAGAVADFGFGKLTADSSGIITISSYQTEPFNIVAVEGFSGIENPTVEQGGKHTVTLYGKLYGVRIEVTDENGNPVIDALVTVKSESGIKKTYYVNGGYEINNLSEAYTVTVNGKDVGVVDENNTYILYNQAAADDTKEKSGCGGNVAGTSALGFAAIMLAAAAMLFAFRKRITRG